MWKVITTSVVLALTASISHARDLRAAIVHPADYPASLAMKHMGEQLSSATKGKFGVKVYGSSTLGSAKDAIEQVKIGAIDMTWISASDVNQMLPETVRLVVEEHLYLASEQVGDGRARTLVRHVQ